MEYEEIREKLLEDDGRPCLSMHAILFFKMILSKTMTVLETGSGRSTIWIAKRVKHILSFENKENWFLGVTERLKEEGLNNVAIIYDIDFPKISFHKIEDKYDIVFLDGSDLSGDRVLCMKSGYKYVKPGGYLIVDDSHRPTYEEGIRICRGTGWPRIDFWGYGYKSEDPKLCSIWRKPE